MDCYIAIVENVYHDIILKISVLLWQLDDTLPLFPSHNCSCNIIYNIEGIMDLSTTAAVSYSSITNYVFNSILLLLIENQWNSSLLFCGLLWTLSTTEQKLHVQNWEVYDWACLMNEANS